MASKRTLQLQLFKTGATRGTVIYAAPLGLCHDHVQMSAVSMMRSWRARRRAGPVQQRREQPFFVHLFHSDTPRSPTHGSPDVAAAVSHEGPSGTPSSPAAAAATGSVPVPASTAPGGPKQDAAKSSSGSASPTQHPSVKANSVSRDVSSGAVVGMMIAVGLTSVLVTLVV
jgi:cobalamin biosynthesis Mg chelatase CobN